MKTKETTIGAMPTLPLCLAYDEAKDDIFRSINESMQKHGIPPFLMESIVTEVWHQVREAARTERQKAEETYRSQLCRLNEQAQEPNPPAESASREEAANG